MEGQKPEEQNQNSNFSFRLFYNSLIDAMSFIPFFAFVGVAFTNNTCYIFCYWQALPYQKRLKKEL